MEEVNIEIPKKEKIVEVEDDLIKVDVLPYDCIFHILSFLSLRSLLTVCVVSKQNWSFSVACRSDRLWKSRYEKVLELTTLSLPRMKIVEKQAIYYDKYRTLKYLEIIEFQEAVYKGGTFLKRGLQSYNVPYEDCKEDHYKIILLGHGNVGKTCLMLTYKNEKFPYDYVPTVLDNYTTKLRYRQGHINLGLWDTAGGAVYEQWRPSIYTDASLYLVCFSLVNRPSFLAVETRFKKEIEIFYNGGYDMKKRKWKSPPWERFNPYLRTAGGKTRETIPPIILCGTKLDLREDEVKYREYCCPEEGVVEREEGLRMAKKIGAHAYFETSSAENKWIKEMFFACSAVATGDDWMKIDEEIGEIKEVGELNNDGKQTGKCLVM